MCQKDGIPIQVALWDFICTLIYPVEIALGLLEASSKKSSRKIMWNLVQAVFIYIVCNDNDLNAKGMAKTAICRGLAGHPFLSPLDAGMHTTMSLTGSPE